MQRLIFSTGIAIRLRRHDAGFWFDLSKTVEAWQLDVWRGTSLVMRQRGSLYRLARGLAEWSALVE